MVKPVNDVRSAEYLHYSFMILAVAVPPPDVTERPNIELSFFSVFKKKTTKLGEMTLLTT